MAETIAYSGFPLKIIGEISLIYKEFIWIMVQKLVSVSYLKTRIVSPTDLLIFSLRNSSVLNMLPVLMSPV